MKTFVTAVLWGILLCGVFVTTLQVMSFWDGRCAPIADIFQVGEEACAETDMLGEGPSFAVVMAHLYELFVLPLTLMTVPGYLLREIHNNGEKWNRNLFSHVLIAFLVVPVVTTFMAIPISFAGAIVIAVVALPVILILSLLGGSDAEPASTCAVLIIVLMLLGGLFSSGGGGVVYEVFILIIGVKKK